MLDEIDQLTDKVIASLLDWNIILIGVGNTFTVTEATGARKSSLCYETTFLVGNISFEAIEG